MPSVVRLVCVFLPACLLLWSCAPTASKADAEAGTGPAVAGAPGAVIPGSQDEEARGVDAASAGPVGEDTPADDLTLRAPGRLAWARFQAGDLDPLWEASTQALRSAIGSHNGLSLFQRKLLLDLGEERELLEEVAQRVGGVTEYRRRILFEESESPFDILVATEDDGTLTGFRITPVQAEAETPYLDYETKTPLRLPFDEAWYVVWGGRTVDLNYHAAYPDQRFAYDILVLRDDATHTGDGTELEQYHAFGLAVLAPGDGTVVAARGDLPDNPPGQMDPAHAMGNHVILDHGNGEYSFLCHLQQDTLTVAEGDEVTAGTLLGLCGNSGNTTEPHIHYHLQDTPDFGAGLGLPAQFLDYVADDREVARGEPLRGEVVRPSGGGEGVEVR